MLKIMIFFNRQYKNARLTDFEADERAIDVLMAPTHQSSRSIAIIHLYIYAGQDVSVSELVGCGFERAYVNDYFASI